MKLVDFTTNDDVFDFIGESSVFGNLGLFIGSGLPMAILNDDWHKVALSWKELIYKACENLDIDFDGLNTEGASYPEICSTLCKQLSNKEGCDYSQSVKKLKEVIASLTSWYPETEKRKEYEEYFEILDPAWIITTNYDLVIECILTGKGFSLTPSDPLIAPKNKIPVLHLHGIRTNPRSIIITQEDYVTLFRPNEYRQQKLPLLLKESVTVLIGYNLGDFNVLTAVDWSSHVYGEEKVNYPHDIIQFLYKEEPDLYPYRTNNIIIVEFNDLADLLAQLAEKIKLVKNNTAREIGQLFEINNLLKDPSENNVERFVDDSEFRIQTLSMLNDNHQELITGFLELFSKSMELTWERAQPRGAFYAYDENLTILLDILQFIDVQNLPPALIEAICFNLNKVAYYVGTNLGQSRAAHQTWLNKKDKMSLMTINELKNVAEAMNFYSLKQLMNRYYPH